MAIDIEQISQRIRKNIKLLRQKAKLTQTQLAIRAGLSADYMPSLEQGKKIPSMLTLCKLANALDVDPCEFLNP